MSIRSMFLYFGIAVAMCIPSNSFAQTADFASVDSLYQVFLSKCGPGSSVRQPAVKAADETFAALEDFIEERISFDSSNPVRSKGLLDYWMAEYYYDNQKYDLALEQGKSALDLCRKSEDSELLSDCLSIISISAIRVGDYQTAIESSNEGLQIDKTLGDTGRLSSSLNSIAGLYLSLRQYDVAKKYIDEAIEVESTRDNSASMAIRLGMASEIYTGLDELDKALDFASRAYELDLAASRDDKAAIRLSQIGAVLLQMKKYDQAEANLIKASELFEKVSNYTSLAITLNQLGTIAANRNEMQLCKNSFERAVEITKASGNLLVEGNAHKGLSEAFEKRDPAYALSHLKEYAKIQKRLGDMETERAAAEFNARYESARKDSQIELQNLTIKREKTVIVSLAIILAVLVLTIAIVLRYASLRKRNRNLVAEAERLSGTLEDISLSEQQSEIKDCLLDVSEALSALSGGQSAQMTDPILTKREIQIALLSCEGLINKEIADRLGIGVRTVESHKSNIYRKLEIGNNAELIAYVHKSGLLSKGL